jgi:16S rRNA C1402 (ribose-2'-O) methylase RsmI
MASELRPPRKRGSLVVVGTGIKLVAHTTREALDAITRAERLFFVVDDPATEEWLRRLNPSATSMRDHYREGKPRRRTYEEMARRLVAAVRSGIDVCAVFYGHPGVFVDPSHDAIRRLKRAGYPARMLPGISTEDCLWQVGLLGEASVRPGMTSRVERVRLLVRTLRRSYPARHVVVLYEAAQFPVCDPVIRRVPLSRLASTPLRPVTTMYVPPRPERRENPVVARWFDEG